MSVLVVHILADGGRRFSELRREIPGVSQPMPTLALTLRNLERDGLVRRTVTPSVPPRVGYELTELGHSLKMPINAVSQWVLDNVVTIKASQTHFDARDEAPELSSIS